MAARPFSLVAGPSLAAVQAVLEGVLAAWTQEWGLAAAPVPLVRRAWEPAAPAAELWRERWDGADGQVHCGWEPSLPVELKRALFPAEGSYAGRSGGASLADGAAEAALDALVAALRERLGGAACRRVPLAAPEPACWTPGSGAVAVAVPLGRAALQCLLDHGAVCRLAGWAPAAHPPLAPVRWGAALDLAPVALRVRAGEVELGAGSLLTLAVGDVLALDVPCDGTFDVLMPGGAVLCQGFIGQREARTAIEIARRA